MIRAISLLFVVLPALADTVAIAPDGATGSGFASVSVADLDESPDTPDGSWAAASDNNTSGSILLDFGAPPANLSTGAQQTFRVWVRQYDTGQSGVPTARLELHESGNAGNPLAIGSDVNVTGAGQMLTMTWNAGLLSSIAGTGVQAQVVTTKSGGSPSSRNAVDVGAVEWVADYVTTPPGWAHKIRRMDNVGKIHGVPVANIKKVSGL